MADEQAALRRVATLVARGVPAAEVFEAVSREARRALGLDSGSLLRFERDGSATLLAVDSTLPALVGVGERLVLDAGTASAQVRSTGQPARVEAYADDVGPMSLGYRGSVGAPVVVEGRLWGVLRASSWAETRAIPADSEKRSWRSSLNSSPPRSPMPKAGPNSARRARGSSPRRTRPGVASSATCTTAPNSGWCHSRFSSAPRKRPCHQVWPLSWTPSQPD